jgi:hypothetical protein
VLRLNGPGRKQRRRARNRKEDRRLKRGGALVLRAKLIVAGLVPPVGINDGDAGKGPRQNLPLRDSPALSVKVDAARSSSASPL